MPPSIKWLIKSHFLIVLFLKHARNYRPVTDQDLEMQEHIKSQTLVTTL